MFKENFSSRKNIDMIKFCATQSPKKKTKKNLIVKTKMVPYYLV